MRYYRHHPVISPIIDPARALVGKCGGKFGALGHRSNKPGVKIDLERQTKAR